MRKKSSIDKRLRALEREADKIRTDIKSVSKSLDSESSEVPLIRDLGGLKVRPAETPLKSSRVAEQEGRPLKLGARRGEQGLFKWQGRGGNAEGSDVSGSADRPQPVPTLFGPDNSAGMSGGDKPQFLNYLSTGSFRTPRDGRRERSVQRNKAVFMIIVVAVALYIVVKLLS
ncbi:MAG: hypothetical protein KJ626_05470 [Verrucomicrobia bacterium]|nr:hypothetical protein [Verrucomicrobiota bacterium]